MFDTFFCMIQAKNGIKTVVTPSARLATLATAGAAGHVAVPNPGPRAAERSSMSCAKMRDVILRGTFFFNVFC